MNTTLKVVTAASFLALGGALVLAGPLNPPGGPVTSTYKTLGEVEPRTPIPAGVTGQTVTISEPGSYYLVGNRTQTSGVAIVVASSDVTIDLGGFTLSGQTFERAITVPDDGTPYSNVTVRNGTVSGQFAQGGVVIGEATGCRVEGVTVRGIPDYGIVVNNGSLLIDCIADGCAIGISADDSLAIGCTATGCSTYGFNLITATARDCLALGNQGVGILANTRSVVEGCTASDNASASGNIYVYGQGNRVDSCTIGGGYASIYIHTSATDALVTRNSLRRGSAWGIIQGNQTEGSFPGNHVAQIISNPASPFNATNPFANIEY